MPSYREGDYYCGHCGGSGREGPGCFGWCFLMGFWFCGSCAESLSRRALEQNPTRCFQRVLNKAEKKWGKWQSKKAAKANKDATPSSVREDMRRIARDMKKAAQKRAAQTLTHNKRVAARKAKRAEEKKISVTAAMTMSYWGVKNVHHMDAVPLPPPPFFRNDIHGLMDVV